MKLPSFYKKIKAAYQNLESVTLTSGEVAEFMQLTDALSNLPPNLSMDELSKHVFALISGEEPLAQNEGN